VYILYCNVSGLYVLLLLFYSINKLINQSGVGLFLKNSPFLTNQFNQSIY